MELQETFFVQPKDFHPTHSKQACFSLGTHKIPVIEIDLVGTFHFSKAAFVELKKTKGTIINISATLHYKTTPWQTHASAAKAGVDSITQSLAHEWGEFGIRCNGIAPGPIADTEGFERLSKGPDAV
jgi:NAD(P)-dependent dehydrogenase (short-subunit alcohol dehydrogenase family)